LETESPTLLTTKIEVVAILSKILDAGTHAATLKAILEHQKRYNVPFSRHRIFIY
jgi:hypothetical protein